MTAFDYEHLDVYQAAIDFVALAEGVVEHLPKGRSHLADQLHRAPISIALNIAEGAGEFSKRDKSRFYRMAQRSATECAAILDVSRRLGLASADDIAAGRGLLLRIVSMLVRMCQSGTGTGTGTGRDPRP